MIWLTCWVIKQFFTIWKYVKNNSECWLFMSIKNLNKIQTFSCNIEIWVFIYICESSIILWTISIFNEFLNINKKYGLLYNIILGTRLNRKNWDILVRILRVSAYVYCSYVWGKKFSFFICHTNIFISVCIIIFFFLSIEYRNFMEMRQ